MAKTLIVLVGPDEGRIFTLGNEPLLLGRSRATGSHLLDTHVSRVHCQIHPEGDQYVITDFDSEAGTFVNGKRAAKEILRPGDIIRIGNTRLQFTDDETTARAPASAPAGKGLEGIDRARTVLGPAGGEWFQELPGQKIVHYKVGSPLARGRSGYLFHARDTRRNLDVALKVLDPNFSRDPGAVQRFVEAMKLVLPLRHPHLIKVYGAGKTGVHCWVAMEYLRGESLAAVIGRIESGGMLDWRHVVRVGIYLGRALDYAHSKKLIHQNVTPTNILVGKAMEETKLADLMLAGAVAADPTKPISQAGIPSEELPFMPPERTSPGQTVDARTDLYSLGATMYAMFTGYPPFQADTVQELVHKIRLEAPRSLQEQHLALPEPLIHLNQKLLAKRPEDRYLSAKELVKNLETIARSHDLKI